MSTKPTFNSRLRILVAKSYKAEKLYNSLRSEHTFQNPERLNKIISASGIAEIANDIRAREWQRAHNELRTALNDVVSKSIPADQPRSVAALLEEFGERYDSDRKFVESNKDLLVEAARREEFGHVLKLSLELVRSKSRAQACKSIVDELNTVLQGSEPKEVVRQVESALVLQEQPRNNVVQLRRKVG